MLKKKNLGFPFSYGDIPVNDGNRLSDGVLIVVKTKKFQNICSAIATIVFFFRPGASSVEVANAIPPEAGEHIAQAANAAVESGQAANVAAGVGDTYKAAGFATGMEGARMAADPVGAAVPARPPVQNMPLSLPGRPDGPGKPPLPEQPPIYFPLGRPQTPLGRTTNTVFFVGSVGWICLNAYWGNPVAIAGCTGMLVTFFARAIGVKIGHS